MFQESYFHWMFGVDEPDFYGALDLATGKSYLFAPKFDENYAIYMGEMPACEELKRKYAVDVVCYVEQVRKLLPFCCVLYSFVCLFYLALVPAAKRCLFVLREEPTIFI